MFMRLQTQWIFAGMGGLVGLNYQSLDLLFRIYSVGREKQREIFEGLRIMESVVLRVSAEEGKKT